MGRDRGITALVLGALFAVPVLGLYQYQWIGRAAKSEHDRGELQLNGAMSAFAGDFDGEMRRATVLLRMINRATPASSNRLPMVAYQATARQLIKAVYYMEASDYKAHQLFALEPKPRKVPVPGILCRQCPHWCR